MKLDVECWKLDGGFFYGRVLARDEGREGGGVRREMVEADRGG